MMLPAGSAFDLPHRNIEDRPFARSMIGTCNPKEQNKTHFGRSIRPEAQGIGAVGLKRVGPPPIARGSMLGAGRGEQLGLQRRLGHPPAAAKSGLTVVRTVRGGHANLARDLTDRYLAYEPQPRI